MDAVLSRILTVSGVRQLDGLSTRNTRTMECGARTPGDLLAEKSEDTDKIPWRLYHFGLLTGRLTAPSPASGTACASFADCANALRGTGQRFDHQETCKAAGNADHDPYPYAVP